MDDAIKKYIETAEVNRKIDFLVCHCAATPEGRVFTINDIRRWHVDGNKWSDIGYHFVIHLDGSVHIGRPMGLAGAHCKECNSRSLGICYIGGVDKFGKPKDTRTNQQKAAFVVLLKKLKERFPAAQIVGHHDFNPGKACPSFDARTEYGGL